MAGKYFEKGIEDGKDGDYSPPKGDAFVDFIFAPIDLLAGSESTREAAERHREEYDRAFEIGSRLR